MANHPKREVTLLKSKNGGPIILKAKQNRNEICNYCGSGVKVKKCSCKWAAYCRS